MQCHSLYLDTTAHKGLTFSGAILFRVLPAFFTICKIKHQLAVLQKRAYTHVTHHHSEIHQNFHHIHIEDGHHHQQNIAHDESSSYDHNLEHIKHRNGYMNE